MPRVTDRTAWLEARKALLTREKALTRARDELAAARRELPMVRVDKEYVFEGPQGTVTLRELFEGRRQLIVDHMMWAYDIDETGEEIPRDTGCPSCSGRADNIGNLVHLHQRDTSFAAVSRAPYSKIAPFQKRMGWTFPWYSSAGSDFNYDFHATADERVGPVLLNYRTTEELADIGFDWSPSRRGDYPGLSAFLQVDDEVFHTYSTFARGLEQIGGTHYYLDLTALGRQEPWEKPEGRATTFSAQAGSPSVRFHDEY